MSEFQTPQAQEPAQRASDGMPILMKGAIWVAIGALIAAAIVTVVWVLLTPEGNIIPRAFVTIALLAGFAGVTLLDAKLAEKLPQWLVMASTIGWVLVLLCGLTMIWSDWGPWSGPQKVWYFVVTIGIVQLALLHVRLFWKAHLRYVTTVTRTIAAVTTAFLLLLVALALLYLAVPYAIDYPDIYGRLMVSLAILAAVGTALIPLLNALFGPRKPRRTPPAPQQATADPLPWPTYSDGVTPLPILQNGQPDFDAARTGRPSPGAHSFAPAPAASPAPVAQSEPAPPASAAPTEQLPPEGSPYPPTPPRPE